jgi:hypothetical protein
MKTATISIYHLFGTNNSLGADIIYRGITIASLNYKGSFDELEKKAVNWAMAQGFTHTKLANII